MNMMRTKVKTDYILFLNEWYVCISPFWGQGSLWRNRKLSDNYFFLSATSIQPHTQSASTILANYGDSIETFQEDKLLKEYMNYKINDWMGATIPPNIVHRDIWDLVAVDSIEYSPGMYSDQISPQNYICVDQIHERATSQSHLSFWNKINYPHTQELWSNAISIKMGHDFIHIPQSFHLQRKRFQIPKDRNFQNRK